MAKSKDHVSLNGTAQANSKAGPIQVSHVVSFRLSNNKYQQLARISDISENSTPSELAREIVCEALNDGRNEEQVGLSLAMRRLAREVMELQERVTRLISMLGNGAGMFAGKRRQIPIDTFRLRVIQFCRVSKS